MHPNSELESLAAEWDAVAKNLRPSAPTVSVAYQRCAEQLRDALRRDAAAHAAVDQQARRWAAVEAVSELAAYLRQEVSGRDSDPTVFHGMSAHAVDALLAAAAGQQPSAPQDEWWDRLADVPGHVSAVHDSVGRLWRRDGDDWFTSAAYSQRLSTAVTDLSGWGPFFAEKADQS